MNKLQLGFVGFGEAGYHIAKGLRDAGLTGISAYDVHTHTPGRGEKIRDRAKDAGVTLCESNEHLASAANVLLSTVTANMALEAAQKNIPHLAERHLYADLNSISPGLKQSIARLVEAQGARFVEIAIMSPVPQHGHRVPMFLGGAHAKALVDLLAPLGMNLEIVSDQVGAASAIKMCRSIVVKGLEALLLECVLGAVPYGADERVFATLDETMPGMDWKKLASYMVGRVIEHGERRARELEEVAVTLRAIGVEPVMTEAIIQRQDWGASLNLLPRFGGKAPDDYRAVVNAIAERGNVRNQG
jgi:3-hydroxyisobutyrate dehydrogenase-like beta-hydroxyacid dehydrogenase